jgi:hypothetical protein
MIPGSMDPVERAEAIKKLEERWVLKSKEKESTPVPVTPKKTRTSLTNPVIKNNSVSGPGLKN